MRPLLVCCLVLAAISPTCFGQSYFNNIDTLAARFINNIQQDDKEKIIVQTDRKVYVAGEKIWFKAFLLNARDNRPDTASKSLFVDLADNNDKVVSKLVLNAVALKTDGAISLKDTLATGYYWLRCYTRRMIEQDSSSAFIQPVYIVNLRKPGNANNANLAETVAREPKKNNGPVIHFYPEGGAMMTGIMSTGAIQVTDSAGNPMIVTGNILNNHDSVVSSFTTNRFGLARVAFYPVWFKKYTAVINTRGINIKYPLAVFEPFAAQLSVVQQNSRLIKALVTLEDSVYSPKFTSFILGISGDSLCFAGIGKGMYDVDIPLDNFPAGIATLLLFDANENLLSERKVFINKDNYSISIKTDKKAYSARENVHLKIDVTDAEGNPLVAALSVSVQDEKVKQLSDILETDTLQPVNLSLSDWLLRDKGKYPLADIDLLMLAQQPEYKNWLVEKKQNLVINEDRETLLHLIGKIENKKNEPEKDRVVTAIANSGENTYFDFDTTKTGGGFQLHMPANADSILLKVQVTDIKGRLQTQDKILLDTFSFPHFNTPLYMKQQFAAANVYALNRLKEYHSDTVFTQLGKNWLTPVVVFTKVKPVYNYDVSKRISQFSHIMTYEMFNQGGINAIGNAMLMVPGMTFKGGYLIEAGSGGFGVSAYDEPIVVMDGVVLDYDHIANGQPGSPLMNFLNTINPRDIDFIEVLTGPEAGIFGVRGGKGAVVINTLQGPRMGDDEPTGLKIIAPKTFHSAPAFPMRDYSNPAIKNDKTPDPRSTIYWNGNVITSTNGKASINFYMADAPQGYIVTVSGITANGDYVYRKLKISGK